MGEIVLPGPLEARAAQGFGGLGRRQGGVVAQHHFQLAACAAGVGGHGALGQRAGQLPAAGHGRHAAQAHVG